MDLTNSIYVWENLPIRLLYKWLRKLLQLQNSMYWILTGADFRACVTKSCSFALICCELGPIQGAVYYSTNLITSFLLPNMSQCLVLILEGSICQMHQVSVDYILSWVGWHFRLPFSGSCCCFHYFCSIHVLRTNCFMGLYILLF